MPIISATEKTKFRHMPIISAPDRTKFRHMPIVSAPDMAKFRHMPIVSAPDNLPQVSDFYFRVTGFESRSVPDYLFYPDLPGESRHIAFKQTTAPFHTSLPLIQFSSQNSTPLT
jgi:hypothetical protein